MNLGEIPRVSKDADINSYLCNEKPVIVTNCSLVSNSVKKWVPSYLAKTFGEDMKLTVKRSKSTLFRYYGISLFSLISLSPLFFHTHTHTQQQQQQQQTNPRTVPSIISRNLTIQSILVFQIF